MTIILKISDLSISFKSILDSSLILDSVSLDIQEGEIVGIVGESGSGKSVTAMSVIGILEDNAIINNGEILFKGKNLLELKEKDYQKIRGREIGMVFQEPMTALNPTMKIGKQLVNVIKNHKKVSKKEAYKIAISSLNDVLIEDPEIVFNKYSFQLSGGMRQRVVIALAMSAPPNLLIADEPTTALDVTIQEEILKLMKKLSDQKGTSIMFIAHDLAVVANICDRVNVMYGGNIVESGLTEEVLYEPLHPYTKGLIESLPEGKPKNEPLKVIEGDAFTPSNRPSGCVYYNRCPLRTEKCLKVPEIVWKSNTHWAACWEVKK